MRHFTDEEVIKLNKMWDESKPTAWQGVFIASMIVLALLIVAFVVIKLVGSGSLTLPVRKGYKVVGKE